MRRYLLIAAALVATLLVLAHSGRDKQPLYIDEPDANPATWPTGAAAPNAIYPVPYQACTPVYRPLAPSDADPTMEVEA